MKHPIIKSNHIFYWQYYQKMSHYMRYSNIVNELIKIVESPQSYCGSFVKKYWKNAPFNKEQEEILIMQILKAGSKLTRKIHFLKWLVYLHILVVSRLQFFKLLSEEILNLEVPQESVTSEFEILVDQAVRAYLIYLQKRILKVAIIRTPPKHPNKDESFQVSFLVLNLINLGCSSCQEVYKLGREYSNEYMFLTDLNAILGMDLRECYRTLGLYFRNLWNRFERYDRKTQHLLNALVDQISVSNEMLYIVFYNTYFYTELKDHLPDWIRCQPIDIGETEENQPQEIKVKQCQHTSPPETAQMIIQKQDLPSPLRRRLSLVRPKQTEVSIQEMYKLMNDVEGINSNDQSTRIQNTKLSDELRPNSSVGKNETKDMLGEVSL